MYACSHAINRGQMVRWTLDLPRLHRSKNRGILWIGWLRMTREKRYGFPRSRLSTIIGVGFHSVIDGSVPLIVLNS